MLLKTILLASLLTFTVFPAFALDCAALMSAKLPDTTIETAASVPAGTFEPPYGSTVSELPAFCRVAGIIRPTNDSEIRFEVWMPESGWNQKYLGVGNGGFAGSIGYSQLGGNLKRGFATAGTDTGHQAAGVDASWAYKHPEKVNDFGWRALHLTTENAKRLIASFYGSAAKHTYFDSCSDGGREALMEAQRFPEDFDGILAGAPANYWTALVSQGANLHHALLNPEAYISSMKLPAIHTATSAACDAEDGVKDGIINDPSRCHFNPAAIACNGSDSLNCLTPPQVTLLNTLYAGTTTQGQRIFPGYTPGAELGPGGWSAWILGEGPGSAAGDAFFQNYFRYMVFEDPAWNPATPTFENVFPAATRKTAKALNSTDPDLRKFASHGSKLILYHGWNDPAIPAQNTIDYYNSVVKQMGSSAVHDFARLYMVPGMQHCLGGPGATSIGQFGTKTAADGVFGALERWVEDKQAPDSVIATKYKDDNPSAAIQMTRPLCPYPQVAKYKGAGDTNDAANFSCSSD